METMSGHLTLLSMGGTGEVSPQQVMLLAKHKDVVFQVYSFSTVLSLLVVDSISYDTS